MKIKLAFTFLILLFHILFGSRVALRRRPQITSNSVFSVVHDVDVTKYLRQTSIVRGFSDVSPYSSSCCAAKVKVSRAEPFPPSCLCLNVTFFPHMSRQEGRSLVF